MITLEISQYFLEGNNIPLANFKHFQCLPGNETIFGWVFPRESKIVNVHFNFLGALRTKYIDDFVAIDTSRFAKPIIVVLNGEQGEKL